MAVPPFIAYIYPPVISPEGNETLEISGLGFVQPVSIFFGSIRQQDTFVEMVSSSLIRVASLPGASGTISVVNLISRKQLSNSKSILYSSNAPAPIKFSTHELPYNISQCTCGVWGPDQRFYVGTLLGEIHILEFDDLYNVKSSNVIETFSKLENPNILGLAFSPFDSMENFRIFVFHTKIYYFDGMDFGAQFYPFIGQVSAIQSPYFDSVEIVLSDLPTSNHDHSVFGGAFDDFGRLLVPIGSNTNAGIPSKNMGYLDESPLSAAIVSASIYSSSYNAKVRYVSKSDPTEAIISQVYGNVSKLSPSVSGVSLLATGFRSPFGMVYTTDQQVFVTDNGPNVGYGRASTGHNTSTDDPGAFDKLCHVSEGSYYGSPNRNRGEDIYYNPLEPSVPGIYAQCFYLGFSSAVGILEYRGHLFGNQLFGDLILLQWKFATYRFSRKNGGILSKLWALSDIKGLNTVYSPGGWILSLRYDGGKSSAIMVSKPMDSSVTDASGSASAAVHPTIIDIFPYRAVINSGARFVISAINLLGNVSTVQFPGCFVSSFSYKSTYRISGNLCIPNMESVDLNGTMQDFTVILTDGTFSTCSKCFKWLLPVKKD